MISVLIRLIRSSWSWHWRKDSALRSLTRTPRRSQPSRTPSITSRLTCRNPKTKRLHLEKRRVVVTGVGLVTALGTGTEKTWQGFCEGRSGVDKITRFDATQFSTRIAAEVRDFDPLQ